MPVTTEHSENQQFRSLPLHESRSWNALALALYGAISLLIIDHGRSITANLLGSGSDVFLANWFLAWWPWAILHHLNPLFTRLVWQPVGLHIAWTTCIPLLALIGLPVTLLAGPVPAYNLLTLAGPAACRLCRLPALPAVHRRASGGGHRRLSVRLFIL